MSNQIDACNLFSSTSESFTSHMHADINVLPNEPASHPLRSSQSMDKVIHTSIHTYIYRHTLISYKRASPHICKYICMYVCICILTVDLQTYGFSINKWILHIVMSTVKKTYYHRHEIPTKREVFNAGRLMMPRDFWSLSQQTQPQRCRRKEVNPYKENINLSNHLLFFFCQSSCFNFYWSSPFFFLHFLAPRATFRSAMATYKTIIPSTEKFQVFLESKGSKVERVFLTFWLMLGYTYIYLYRSFLSLICLRLSSQLPIHA